MYEILGMLELSTLIEELSTFCYLWHDFFKKRNLWLWKKTIEFIEF